MAQRHHRWLVRAVPSVGGHVRQRPLRTHRATGSYSTSRAAWGSGVVSTWVGRASGAALGHLRVRDDSWEDPRALPESKHHVREHLSRDRPTWWRPLGHVGRRRVSGPTQDTGRAHTYKGRGLCSSCSTRMCVSFIFIYYTSGHVPRRPPPSVIHDPRVTPPRLTGAPKPGQSPQETGR